MEGYGAVLVEAGGWEGGGTISLTATATATAAKGKRTGLGVSPIIYATTSSANMDSLGCISARASTQVRWNKMLAYKASLRTYVEGLPSIMAVTYEHDVKNGQGMETKVV